MAKSYKATIEYRDEWTRGKWSTHTVICGDRDDAIRMVRQHCSDCESRNLKVEEVEE